MSRNPSHRRTSQRITAHIVCGGKKKVLEGWPGPVNPLVSERFQVSWGQSTAPELAYKPQPGGEHTWWQRDSILRAYCRCYQAQPPRLGAKLGRRCFIAFARDSAAHARETSIIVQLSKVSASSKLKLREEPARDCHRQPRRLKF